MTTNTHWYAIDNSGMATLCVDEHDARESAKEFAELYPKRAPYVVGQLCQPAMPADADAGWREAAYAWDTCARINNQLAKDRGSLFKARQEDFANRADAARRRIEGE